MHGIHHLTKHGLAQWNEAGFHASSCLWTVELEIQDTHLAAIIVGQLGIGFIRLDGTGMKESIVNNAFDLIQTRLTRVITVDLCADYIWYINKYRLVNTMNMG